MNNDFGHWTTSLDIPEEMPYGFIYIITNTTNGRMYIGKKQMKSIKKLKPLKGKKNKRHFGVETDWKTYTSSSSDVNNDIIKFGKNNFTFQIIRFCDSKSALSYYEAKMQFDNSVLFTDNYYNGIINCRLNRNCFKSSINKIN